MDAHLIKEISLEELAKRFQQYGNTCAVAGMMFSAAMTYRDCSFAGSSAEKDFQSLLINRRNYLGLVAKIMARIRVQKPGHLDIHDIAKYFEADGYSTLQLPAGRAEVERNAAYFPVVPLHFDSEQKWFEFSGSNIPNNWCSSHVVCVIGLQDEDFVYFEPFTGEIKTRHRADFERVYGHKTGSPTGGLIEVISQGKR